MQILGAVLLALGGLIALAGIAHDVNRLRIAARTPQAAPRRFLVEAYVLAALLSGAGCWALWGWLAAAIVLLAQGILTAGVVRPLLERYL